MDRRGIALERRRQLVLDRLEDERNREAALTDRLEDLVTELEGPAVDAEVIARLSEEHAAVVREAIGGVEEEMDVDGFFDDLDLSEEAYDPVAENEAEIARLQGEIDRSRTRQEALQAYLDALAAESERRESERPETERPT